MITSWLMLHLGSKRFRGKGAPRPEPVLLNVYVAQESIPRNEFRKFM
jgi:hypothetical protein